MQKHPAIIFFILVLCCFASAQKDNATQAVPVGKVELLDKVPDGAAAAVQQVLDPKGYRVLLDDGSVACELWVRKTVPGQAKSDTSGIVYPQLAESTLVGVISFPQASTDYRGQAIKSGTYTLRYELQPADGNHMGVSPTRDFLLLIPAGSDADPKTVYKFQELVAQSEKATQTKHPGVLNLVEPPPGSAPAVSRDDEEHWIFSAGTKLESGQDLTIALVVRGTAPQ